MVGIPAVAETLKSAGEIISIVRGDPNAQLDRNYGRANDDVVRSLRRIYFTPDGIRAVLSELAAGRTPSSSLVEQALIGFNDAEWRVRDALLELEFGHLQGRRELSLQATEQLHQLRYGKIDIRRQLQEALNEPLTIGTVIDPEVAQNLLARVDAVNSEIASLEAAHNHRARGR